MRLTSVFLGLVFYFFTPSSVFALTPIPEITNYTTNTLQIITALSLVTSVLFLIKGGYFYITSSGKPQALEDAKKTIRNALLGLLLVLGSGTVVSLLKNSFTSPANSATTQAIKLAPLVPVMPSDGLTQVLIDAVNGLMQNMVQSATKPIVDAIFTFLTTTPSVLTNSVIFNFWLVILGITDSLFVLVVAILGLRFMSAATFGFEELELKSLLPRIGLAFLGANVSLFLADYVITTCNALVFAVLNLTGGLNQAWILNAINLDSYSSGTTPLITLTFLVLFLIVSVVLLLFYITRLIAISLGAVLSPLIFLLWLIPKFSDFAEISIKSYIVTVFSVFVHVVIIQLASSFLILPQASTNSLISIAVGIGLLFTLLKTPSFLMQLVFYNSGRQAFKKVGSQIMNILTTSNMPDTNTIFRANPNLKTSEKGKV
jgi:hypothetical protein